MLRHAPKSSVPRHVGYHYRKVYVSFMFFLRSSIFTKQQGMIMYAVNFVGNACQFDKKSVLCRTHICQQK